MKVKNKQTQKLLEKYKEISLLNNLNTLLGWDLNVNLPIKASEGRARQSAYVTKLVAEKWLDPEFKKLLDSLDQDSPDLNQEERAIVRNLKQQGKFYFKVPKEIVVEFSETTSKAFMTWQRAKVENKFKDFLPELKKVIRLNQIMADHLGYKDNPYDALLDLFEPGLIAEKCKEVFGDLRPELTRILKKIQNKKGANFEGLIGDGLNYPIDDQEQLSLFVLKRMNYDFEAGRQDVSSHPFTETLGRYDVRITNRYRPDSFVESIMVAMHEGGHALYEQGVNEEYESTPLDGGISLGIHESQSRFWENQVGRSFAFIKFLTPIMQAFYPKQLAKIGSETFFTLFNNVEPGLIRVEADEVTYNLHIALRFELENALINNKIKAEDLPEIWHEKMKKYLGIVPKTDREGVLQDVHWSYGSFGYFPTYTLGNLYAAQFTAAMKKELNIDELAEKGELGTILSWLRTNIHQNGSLYWPGELVQKVTGKKLSSKFFLDYIRDKYSRIYSIRL